MALTAWAIDTLEADAQVMRQAMASLIGSAGGLVKTGDLAITQKGTPDMHVLVAAGGVWVPGNFTTTTGMYFAFNSASIEQAVVAAGATNPRVDTVVMRILDKAYEGTEAVPKIEVLKGTEEAGATLANKKGIATLTKSSYVLAYVLVPANATSIVTADIENVATVVSPGLSGLQLPAATAYGAAVTRANATLYEPSATRATLVVLFAGRTPEERLVSTVFVGGVNIASCNIGTGGGGVGPSTTFTFIVPAGVKWEVTGAAEKLKSVYLTL